MHVAQQRNHFIHMDSMDIHAPMCEAPNKIQGTRPGSWYRAETDWAQQSLAASLGAAIPI